MQTTIDLGIELNLLQNMWGPISNDIRQRLVTYVNDPSIENWEDAHGILIQPNLTLWQAIAKLNPDWHIVTRCVTLRGAIIRDWDNIPTSQMALDAIRYAAFFH